MNPKFQDKPTGFPQHSPNGAAIKPLPQILLERRATPHFKPDPVPEEHLEAILQLAAQAPSGYNLQPWRFIVVREKANRERLQKAAYNQEKIGEAPVVVIAFALKGDWKNYLDAIFQEGLRRGYGKPEMVPKLKKQASDFLEKGIPAQVWVNRHTMIAVTTMMLMAEAYGLDTAPMEGFDPPAIVREFGLPENAEIIALLAIGYGKEPDKPYAGRLALSEILHDEVYGRPWNEGGRKRGPTSDDISEVLPLRAVKPLKPA